MNLLLDSTLKVTIVVLVALAVSARARKSSAAVRHCVLASALACAAVMPALGIVAPAWSLPSRAGSSDVAATAAMPARPASAAVSTLEGGGDALVGEPGGEGYAVPGSVSWADRLRSFGRAVVPLWLAGAAVGLAVLVAGLARLTWLVGRARPVQEGRWTDLTRDIAQGYGLRRTVRLLIGTHPGLLVTWGFLRPTILLPPRSDRWNRDRIRIVLAHELAHVRRGDWVVQVAAQFLRSVYWFNPLMWMACSRVVRESEQACDDLVLSQGITGPDYASHLLDLARLFRNERAAWSPAPSIARSSSLERRVGAMLKPDIDRRPASRRIVGAAAAALLTMAIPLAGFQAFADTFSTVAGVVSDPHGGLVSDVTVTLANPRKASRYEVRTDAAGQYEFVGVPPGDYVLEAGRAGFKLFKHGVSVAGGDVRRDIALQIGSLRETIVVAGAQPERERVTAADTDAQLRFERDLAECRAAGASAGGGRLRPPRKIRHVAPRYPDSLRAGGPAETVTLEARIDTQGQVADVQPIGDAPADLVAAAIEAVNAWQFQPTLLNCEPVDVWMTVSIEFRPSLKPAVSIEIEPSPGP